MRKYSRGVLSVFLLAEVMGRERTGKRVLSLFAGSGRKFLTAFSPKVFETYSDTINNSFPREYRGCGIAADQGRLITGEGKGSQGPDRFISASAAVKKKRDN